MTGPGCELLDGSTKDLQLLRGSPLGVDGEILLRLVGFSCSPTIQIIVSLAFESEDAT